MILHHVLEGTGPAVLLLHSTAADARQWRAQIRELRGEVTVVAPDLRGYGRSPLGSEPFSHAGDVVGLMDELGLDRCAVVGSSGGGAVALQVASTVPERVSALVLLCAAAEDVEVDLLALPARPPSSPEAATVSGGRDLAWFRAVADHLAAELPRAVHVDLPWAGHLPNLERPTETTQLIRRSIRP